MTYEWATDEWFTEVVRSGDRLKPTPGTAFTAQYVIVDTPRGTIKYVERIHDGKIQSVLSGEDSGADVIFTMNYCDYKRMITQFLASHELPSCRIEGELTKLRPLAPIRNTPEFQAHRAHIVAMTIWP